MPCQLEEAFGGSLSSKSLTRLSSSKAARSPKPTLKAAKDLQKKVSDRGSNRGSNRGSIVRQARLGSGLLAALHAHVTMNATMVGASTANAACSARLRMCAPPAWL